MDETIRRRVEAAIEGAGALDGALLPVLHAIQDSVGHIPPDSVPLIARALNLSRAEVHGTISFYHHFATAPRGRTVVQVCRAEACQARGGRALEAHACAKLGIGFGETTADGATTLAAVYCLGNCASGPSVMVGETLHGNVDATRFDALLETVSEPVTAIAGKRPGSLPKTVSEPVISATATGGTGSDTVLFVPGDATARALGADAVADAIRRAAPRVRIVRNGSRGAFFLEPLVEVATAAGRVAYGPVKPEDVGSLLAADFLSGSAHPLRHGAPESIPFLAKQQRLTFRRAGAIDPSSLDEYRMHGGYRGLARALSHTSAEIVAAITESGLRGRGGAAFPAGIKWRTALETDAPRKYVVANADEGDSGTFADRLLIEADPFALIEGMTIAGLAVGASKGFVYLRCEYPDAYRVLDAAIRTGYAAGVLGKGVCGSAFDFDLEVRLAAGAYICGEETSLLESLEGKRGQVRFKPPMPAQKGLFGMPTIVNNVLTLAAVPDILAGGAERYHDLGVGRSRGTIALQLAGNIARGGLVEAPFGITLREAIEGFGGGTASGRPIRAVQVGGPLGAYLPASRLDTVVDYEAIAAAGGMLGHGGIVVFDDTVDMAAQARFAMEFCAIESCGKCTPCRIGSKRGVEVIEALAAGRERARNEKLLRELCDTMLNGSLCALGGMAPFPVLSALDHFPGDFAGG